jgi:hypothetical protein
MFKRFKIGVAALAGLLALGFGGAALAGATQNSAKHATKHAAKHATRHTVKHAAAAPAAKTAQTPADTETNDGPDQQGEHLDPGEKAGGPETPDPGETAGSETADGPDTDNVQQ